MLFACVVFVLLFWRNFPLRKALIGDSVDSEGQGLWLGRGLWGDSWPLTLHKEDMSLSIWDDVWASLVVTQADMVVDLLLQTGIVSGSACRRLSFLCCLVSY